MGNNDIISPEARNLTTSEKYPRLIRVFWLVLLAVTFSTRMIIVGVGLSAITLLLFKDPSDNQFTFGFLGLASIYAWSCLSEYISNMSLENQRIPAFRTIQKKFN